MLYYKKKLYYKKSIFVEYNIKANKEVLNFGDIEIDKRKFYHTKNQIWILILIKYWHITRFLLLNRVINTLLAPKIMIITIKLSYYA